MYDLVTYMEDVAKKHKDIKHTIASPKFFRCSGIANVEELLSNLPNANGTILMVDINLGGMVIGNTESFTDIPVFMFHVMKRAEFNNLVEQDEVKKACKTLGMNILAKLKHDRYEDNFSGGTNGLRALDLSRIPYDTIGPIANQWYGCMVTFRIEGKASDSGMVYNAEDYE